ncbi:uncharacterized protein PHACADRAFT_248696 [Phanerochaete carnosa HHB-10118-sp]|uniref:Uncharacterized protein n=1 Tax=Phanerochaete carnosa (strain HHB-10118-sp) TaxID=650164 RepID=K5XFI4_PHACS|nr:uncharacterized protein PHACADRAFT_248696 [Phanerochaete carnosa HHB-10118-sp]EKM61827.1 hypothetical protein PHACADRAFT_248696 [Phanerochaete carnosa HHB-10118-sp]
MLPLAHLPTGYYLIASHTHSSKVTYAGRLSSSSSKAAKRAMPLLSAFDEDDEDDTLVLAVNRKTAVSYFKDSTDDWAFLEQLDEELPLRTSAPSTPSTTAVDSESDVDSPLSPILEGSSAPTTPLLVTDSALESSESDDEEDTGRVRFAKDMRSLARRAKHARGRKVFAVPGEQPQWLLEKLPNGRYTIKTLGAPTGIRDGLLLAYDAHFAAQAVEEWELRPHVVPGPKGRERERELVYTIEWASGGAGWVRQGGADEELISVAPMSGQVREDELWKIVPVSIA